MRVTSTWSHLLSFGADRDLLVTIVSSIYVIVHVVRVDKTNVSSVDKIITFTIIAPPHLNPSFVFCDMGCTYLHRCHVRTINNELIEGRRSTFQSPKIISCEKRGLRLIKATTSDTLSTRASE